MSTVDPSGPLDAALRARLAALRQRSPAATRTAPTRAQRPPQGLSNAMAQRIQAIDPDDPQRPRKAVRIWLEAQITREFGAGLVNDPALASLLDAVQQQMDEDEGTAAAVEALGQLLLAGRIAPA